MGEISLLATLIASVSGFVLGALWYGPVFGQRWMHLVGMTKETLESGFNPVKAYGLTFVLSFISALVLGWALGPDPSFTDGLGCGLVVGAGWVAASLATNDLFERRPAALTLINSGYHVVRFVLMGLIFGLLG
jgi:MFS family permease